MPNNVNSVGFTDYSAESADIERRRQMAQALQMQGMEPIKQEMAGGWVVPTSWTQGLSQALKAGLGGYQQRQATEAQKALAARARTEATEFAGSMPQGTPATPESWTGEPGTVDELYTPGKAATEPTRQQLQAWALRGATSGNPITQGFAGPLVAQYMKPKDDYNLAPDATRMSGTSNTPLATNPRAPEYHPVTAAGPTGAPETQFYDRRRPPGPIPQPVQNQYLNTGGEQTPVPRYSPLGAAPVIPNTKPPTAPAFGPLQQGPGGLQQTDATSGRVAFAPKPPAAAAAAVVASGISDDAITNAATRYRATGTMPPMGMGTTGALIRAKILNKAAEQAKLDGNTPESEALRTQTSKANQQALGQLVKQQNLVIAFEKNAVRNADLVLEKSAGVDRLGSPAIDRWIQAGKKSLAGDVSVAELDTAMRTFVNEYARVTTSVTGGGITSDTARREIEELLRSAMTKDQVIGVVNLMKREMNNRKLAYEDQVKELTGSMAINPTPQRRSTDAAPATGGGWAVVK